jgi:hypothetical protein
LNLRPLGPQPADADARCFRPRPQAPPLPQDKLRRRDLRMRWVPKLVPRRGSRSDGGGRIRTPRPSGYEVPLAGFCRSLHRSASSLSVLRSSEFRSVWYLGWYHELAEETRAEACPPLAEAGDASREGGFASHRRYPVNCWGERRASSKPDFSSRWQQNMSSEIERDLNRVALEGSRADDSGR